MDSSLSLIRAIGRRISGYYQIPPSAGDIRFFGLTFLIWGLGTYFFLHLTGFFALKSYPFTLPQLLKGLLTYLFVPSTLEESIYRPVFFPRYIRLFSTAFWCRALFSTTVFVLAHPITAYLFMPEELSIFSDWRFLIAVTGLGMYCSVLIVRTKNIYFSILTHYILVVAWKFVCCGEYISSLA